MKKVKVKPASNKNPDKLPKGLKFVTDKKLELSPERQKVALDAFSREHDFETFKKKRAILNHEH